MINHRGWTVVILCNVAWLIGCAFAKAAEPKLPYGYACKDVRKNVAKYGLDVAEAFAKLRGFTQAEIDEARKCLSK